MAQADDARQDPHSVQPHVSLASWFIFNEWEQCQPSVVAAGEPAGCLPGAWANLDEFISAHAGLLDSLYLELGPLLVKWDQALAPWGGDPTHQNWRRFRPLRLSREEDWSDWLAFLLERCVTGVFPSRLLQPVHGTEVGYARPSVDREVSHDGHRADLVVRWVGGRCTHIEVKIGDDDLGKTFGTGRKMRLRYGKTVESWENFVLLLPSQSHDWEELESTEPGEPPVEALTWVDVCVALRSALLAEESLSWKGWAYAFVGAAEQLLVGFPGHLLRSQPSSGVEAKVEILRESLRHG
jgi:hypothetical protein